MRPHRYIPGPPVCGFWGMFERDFGNPKTPTPYPIVTASCMGGALLPFRCPHCSAVIDWGNPKRRERYHDTRVSKGVRRNNYWCPRCKGRFRLAQPKTLVAGIPNGAGFAPYEVARGGKVERHEPDRAGWWQRLRNQHRIGIAVLGAG